MGMGKYDQQIALKAGQITKKMLTCLPQNASNVGLDSTFQKIVE